MWKVAFLISVALQNILCAPQFVSLKDGKVGVNFGGYHAEAGLGGLLTGNAAHGGLSASAGTPYGQEAAAGLGGVVNGRAAGGLFAGATAGGDVGASAGLGGVAGGEFTDSGLGAEAHSGGVSQSVVSNGGRGGFQITKHVAKVAQPAIELQGQGDFYTSGNSGVVGNVNVAEESSVVQRVKPPKKYPTEVVPDNTVVVEKRFEIPTVQANVGFEAEAAPKVQAAQVQAVQQVVPVKQKPVFATAAIETVPQQPIFNFQKSFGFNLGGGYAQAPAEVVKVAPAPPVIHVAPQAPAPPPAPVVPVPQYYPQTFFYRKHFRPWHHRAYVQKQFSPVIYQPVPVPAPQVVPVVQKRKQVVVQAAPAPVPVQYPAQAGGFSGSFQGGVDTRGLFDSIFNIPIATLKAVNGLLNTKVQAGGGLSVQKSAGLYYN